jgi:hypothetical protein
MANQQAPSPRRRRRALNQVRVVATALFVLSAWAPPATGQRYWSWEDLDLNQPRPSLVVLTDRAGVTHSLKPLPGALFSAPHFVYAQANYDKDYLFSLAERGQLEVITSPSPRRSMWIPYSQIRLATFERTTSGSRLTVALDDGSTVVGAKSDELTGFKGATDVGETTISVDDIRTVEFVEFHFKGGSSIKREQLSRSWRAAHEKAALECSANITDGNQPIIAKSFHFQGTWRTNNVGAFVSSRPTWRVSYRLDALMFRSGTLDIKVPIKDIESLGFSGKSVDGRPEVAVTRRDGKRFDGQLTMTVEQRRNAPDSLGPVGENDLLVWFSAQGWESVSLVPVRPMVVKLSGSCR